MVKLLSIPGLFLVGALAFMAAPASNVAASDCGANEGHLCWDNESCINIIFYKQCTTKYKYWEGL
jgi:hypothetical protein